MDHDSAQGLQSDVLMSNAYSFLTEEMMMRSRRICSIEEGWRVLRMSESRQMFKRCCEFQKFYNQRGTTSFLTLFPICQDSVSVAASG